MPDELPDGIDSDRMRDLRGRRDNPWVRRLILTLFLAFLVAGLLNVFGQRESTSVARGNAVTMKVTAPPALRAGDIFQLRLHITAPTGIQSPKVVLSPGLLDGLTINTVSPDASTQLSRDGATVLSYDAVDPGETLDLFIQIQVNATAHGRHKWVINLEDDQKRILSWHKTVPIFP